MILVSGATGNVGRYLISFLLKRNARVRILIRDQKKAEHLDKQVERAIGDLDKPKTLVDAMHDVERLYFVTPLTAQVQNLLDAAKQAGVRHVVKQSTIEADRYLGPGRWHREQEELVKGMGFDWTFLRPTMMAVNTLQWWSATIKSTGSVFFPGGRGKVPVVDPQDIAAVACSVLTGTNHEGRIYNVTGPNALSIAEMVEILGEALGKPLRYVNVPAFAAGLWMRRFGLSRELVSALLETLRALRRNEYSYVTDVVARIGGITPRSFDDWCRENAAAFQ